MEVEPGAFTDNQEWSGLTEAGLNAPKGKARRKSRNRRRNRQRSAENASAESERRIELPFTIWDRAHPDVLIHPDAPVVQPAPEAQSAAAVEAPPTVEAASAARAKEDAAPVRQHTPAEAVEALVPPSDTRTSEPVSPQVSPNPNVSSIMNRLQTPTVPERPAPQDAPMDERFSVPPLSPGTLPQLSPDMRKFFWHEPEDKSAESPSGGTHDNLPTPPVAAAAQAASEAPATETHESAPSETPPSLPANPNAHVNPLTTPEGHTETEEPQEHTAGAPAAFQQPAESFNIGEQLQQVANQTATRAAELAARNQPAEVETPELATEHRAEQSPRSTPDMEPIVATDAHAEQAKSKEAQEQSLVAQELHHEDLLALANSISIEGVSVAEMFRAKRLDEVGLRRIIAAFLRGEDVKRLVADEVIRYQMRFERDPQLRQLSLANQPAAGSSSTTKRTAAVKDQAKALFNPKHAKQQADRLADRLLDEFDRAHDAALDHPTAAKTMGGILAVIIYVAIIVIIIRS